jgi:hypothetical protein
MRRRAQSGSGEDALGGSALLIYGVPSANLLTPRPAPRSLTDRMLGRHPVSGPTETPIGRDRVMLEIPSDPLRPLADHFHAFVKGAFDDPWPSTKNILDYLALDVITTYLRGDRSGEGEPSWYFQMMFSACAGMADTSAEVGVHWAEIWYRRSAEELASKYFLPFGFTPQRVNATGPEKRFVPLGEWGYALMRDEEDPTDLDSNNESRYFELDYSARETFAGVDLTPEWQELDEGLSDVRAAGLCLCQLCAPAQDLSRFNQLSIVRSFNQP